MKKFAVSSLALAMFVGGAQAQSPFFQPPVQPIQPVAAMQPAAAPLPPGGVVPVRVHFGGALTKNGVVPVPVYLNQSAAPMMMAPAGGGIVPVQAVEGGRGGPEVLNAPKNVKAVTEETCAPEITDPRFSAPNVDDMRRPDRAPCGYRWYAGAEYLQYLWVKKQESPVLLLEDGVPFTTADAASRDRLGGRFTLGHWLDWTHNPWALEGTLMFTGQRRTRDTHSSNGVVVLEHPFIDAGSGLPDSLPVAIDVDLAPRSGTSEITTSHRMFGFEVGFRRELARNAHGHLDMLLGYRQFHLDEGIAIRDKVIYNTVPIPLSDATVTAVDEFGTHNRLFAGQVGFEGELNWRRFFVDGWVKFAMGANQEVINVNGATLVRETPGRLPPPDTLNGKNFVGGVYTQPSNIGRYHDSEFTVMPEVGVNFGVSVTSNLRVAAGYNFLYLNNVVRPGDAIDSTINRNQIPQLQPLAPVVGTRPAPPTFVDSSYWAHGLTVQMEFRY